MQRDELPEVEHGPDLPYEQCPDRPGVVKFSLLLSLLGRVAVRLAGGWRSAIQLNTIGPDIKQEDPLDLSI